ncbi:IclR family transcriptional regulator [Saccharopolyspora sp. 5N708]|uniref:IclR family transcriptional regulator n=1 Tax=Saccharopolyspora sp. 5N708 TaxID=3457424 RepID=UPI003FD27E0F
MNTARSPRPRSNLTSRSGPVQKLLVLLEAIAVGPRRFTELEKSTGLPKSTTHRMLEVLIEHGLVAKLDSTYTLGERFHSLVHMNADSSTGDLQRLLTPYLVELLERVGHVVIAGVLSGSEVFCVRSLFKHDAAGLVRSDRWREPTYCTALGKVLLAYTPGQLEKLLAGVAKLPAHTSGTISTPTALRQEVSGIRRRGYAFARDEYIPGITGVAAPVLDRSGMAVAGIGVTGRSAGFDKKAVILHTQQVSYAASLQVRRAQGG